MYLCFEIAVLQKIIKNVIIVVPVFITNCHTSENLNIGPVAAQRITIGIAIKKA